MNDFASAFYIAFELIGTFDVELRAIVFLSLEVSLTASACAFVIGVPLGTGLALYRFPGRGVLVVIANTLLGLPPVVAGIAVYLLLSRSGPLGSLGLLFTPAAMMIAQTVLGTPIVIALVHRVAVGLWRAYGDSLLISGASRLRAIRPLMRMGRRSITDGFSGRLWPRFRGSRRHHHRRRQHSGLHPYDDDHDRAGDQQGRVELGARAWNNSARSFDGSERCKSLFWTRPD
jgi:hypothetical protein